MNTRQAREIRKGVEAANANGWTIGLSFLARQAYMVRMSRLIVDQERGRAAAKYARRVHR